MRSPQTISKTLPDMQFGEIDRSYRLLRSDVSDNERKSASSIPTAGSYVTGDFVWNSSPSIDGNNMVLLGWSRLTTGSNHVVNTDWALCYISTVSPAT